ncbi:MAG: Dabb family protein [Steroidobacteraceae bacterium]
MRVNHLVIIKFKEGVTETRIATHLAALASLRAKMPELIVDLSLGRNFTDRAQGYTHAVTVTLSSKEALPAYLQHPEHQAVAAGLREDAEYLVLDYEF